MNEKKLKVLLSLFVISEEELMAEFLLTADNVAALTICWEQTSSLPKRELVKARMEEVLAEMPLDAAEWGDFLLQ